jgi:hypothetical protein
MLAVSAVVSRFTVKSVRLVIPSAVFRTVPSLG